MDGALEIAKLLKERENKKKLGALIGNIEYVDEEKEEVTISFLEKQILKKEFYSLISNFSKKDINKKILAIPTENNQEFFVLGYFKKFEEGG